MLMLNLEYGQNFESFEDIRGNCGAMRHFFGGLGWIWRSFGDEREDMGAISSNRVSEVFAIWWCMDVGEK